LQALSLDVRVLDHEGAEIDLKQKFDEDEDITEAATAPSEFDEENVMTSMDGYTLDEGGEDGNMFDDSLLDSEDDNMFDLDDGFGSDEI
jgi:DNA-directed RNA polymerase subunit beta